MHSCSLPAPCCPAAGETLKEVEGTIEFHDVQFCYPSRPGGMGWAAWLGVVLAATASLAFHAIYGWCCITDCLLFLLFAVCPFLQQMSRCSATLT